MRNPLRKRARQETPAWVRVAYASHAPEAEMMADILRQGGVPVFFRRTGGFDVPDMLAAGARELLVPADRAQEAKELLDPFEWTGAQAR